MPDINFYLVRPYPDGVNRIKEFKERGCIGIGWSGLKDVTGMRKAELREALANYLSDEKQLRSTLGTFIIFCLDIKVGDYIIAPENKMGDIHIARITSDYYFDKNAVDLDFAHQRKAEWSSVAISRDKIAAMNNERLVGALKFPGTAANLQAYRSELSALLAVNTINEISSFAEPSKVDDRQLIKTSYPLRPNVNCEVSFPPDMTSAEAQRFATFISTLYFSSPNTND